MARLSHYAEYALVRGLGGFAGLLTDKGADIWGARMGRLAAKILTGRLEIARDNLRRALDPSLSDAEINDIALRVFSNIGRTMFELTRQPRLTPQAMSDMVQFEGEHRLKEALQRGRGVILVTPHFGNWELGAAMMATRGYTIHMLVTTQHNQMADRYLTKLRLYHGVRLIRVGKSLKQIFKALKDNQIVAIAADQHAPAESLILDFFGRKAATARGPALFASRTGAPIFPFCMRREHYKSHIVIPGEPIYPEAECDPEEDIRRMTVSYLKFFEDCIRAYPDQWMWTHRRWKIR